MKGLDLFYSILIKMPSELDIGSMLGQPREIGVGGSSLIGHVLLKSRTCPHCGFVRSKVKGRVFRCPKCHVVLHRDQVGACNIRQKYLGCGPVVGAMAPPTGLRFRPQTRVARWQQREAAPL